MCQMWKLSIPRNRRGKKQQKSCQRTFLLDYKAMRINFFPDWAVLQPKYSTFLFSVDTNKLCWKRFHLNWKHTKIAPCAQVVGFVLSVYVSPQILLHPVSALAGSEQSAWVGGRSLEGCPQVPLIEMPIYKPELCFSFFCLFKCLIKLLTRNTTTLQLSLPSLFLFMSTSGSLLLFTSLIIFAPSPSHSLRCYTDLASTKVRSFIFS